MEAIGILMLVGGVVGSGISGVNTVKSACENAKSALELLVKQKKLQEQWNSIFTKEAVISQTLINDIRDTNNDILTIQNQMKINFTQIKKQKKIIVVLGFITIIVVFFLLVIKYFIKYFKKINQIKTKKI